MFERQKLNKEMQDASEDNLALDELLISNQALNYTEAIQILNRQEADMLIDEIQILGRHTILEF